MIEKIFKPGFANDPSFPAFSTYHIVPIILILISICLIFKFKHKLNIEKNRKIFGKLLGIVMLIQAILLYGWYIYSGIGLQDALPLYMCRVVAVVMIYDLLFSSTKFHYIAYFWGLLGGIIALLTPDTSGWVFPHIMYTQFFITHGCMLSGIFLFVVIDGYKPSKKDFLKMTNFTIIFFLSVNIINFILDSNYSYFSAPPQSLSFFEAFPSGLIYKIGFLILLLVLNVISYMPFYVAEKRNENEDEDFYLSN